MLRRFPFVLGLLALAGFACMSDGQEKAKTDQNGDALPAGALARMGSLRMRHGDTVSFVAFTQDGKAVLSAANDGSIRLWDRTSGKELRRFDQKPVQPGGQPGVMVVGWNAYGRGSGRIAISRDGKMLATVLQNNIIQLWDVESGKELRQLKPAAALVTSVHFAADAKSIALIGNDRSIHLWDTEKASEIRQIKAQQNKAGGARILIAGGINGADGIAMSHDGKVIAVSEGIFENQKFTRHVRLTETQTGKEIRTFEVPQAGVSSIAFSPDGKILAVGSNTTIHIREADGSKEIRQVNTGVIAGVIFSPDSKIIAVKGRDSVIRLYEADTGKATVTVGEALGAAGVNVAFGGFNFGEQRDFAFSADSKLIGVGSGQTLRFFTVAEGKEQSSAGSGHRGAVLAVLLTPDGKTMLSRGADNVIRRWDAADGKELGSFVEPKGTVAAVFSPDGKTVALANVDGTIRLVTAKDGKEIYQVKGHANGQIAALTFSPDSKVLASRGSFDGMIRLYDTINGGELKQITLPGANAMAGGGFVGRNPYGTVGQGLVFSPDGQTLAANINASNVMIRQPNPAPIQVASAIHMWDVSTAKEVRKITLPANRNVTNLAFSPDGRILAAENTDQTLSLWELASGRERALLGTPVNVGQPNQPTVFIGGVGGMVGANSGTTTTTLAFSPDGALLAVRNADKSVRVWQVSHAKEIGALKGHDGAINALYFAADSKRLASASADTTLLVWDVAGLKREPAPAAANLSAKDVESLWADLISDDAGRASRSIQSLAASSKHATPFLGGKLKPAAPPDVKMIDQWVADLDSTNFPKRTKATAELEKLGELAIPALRKILETRPSPEVRRRVEPLLEKLTTGVLSAEQVRLIRAVEVLENAGGADARAVLQTLAKGAPGALSTRQSQAALDRMAK